MPQFFDFRCGWHHIRFNGNGTMCTHAKPPFKINMSVMPIFGSMVIMVSMLVFRAMVIMPVMPVFRAMAIMPVIIKITDMIVTPFSQWV